MRALATASVVALLAVAVVTGIVLCDADEPGERCGTDSSAQSLRPPRAAASSSAHKPWRLLAVAAVVRALERPSLQSVEAARPRFASCAMPPPPSNPVLRV